MNPTRLGIVLVAAIGLAEAQSPAFEVASIKPANPDAGGMSLNFVPGGGLKVTNNTLRQLIAFAYDVRDFQISGGPGWLGSARYDILAKPEKSEGPASLPGNMPDPELVLAQQQMRERLRALLAERFQLTVHKETKEVPVYALVVARNGPKLVESKEVDGGPSMSLQGNRARTTMTSKRTTMQLLATTLAGTLGRPVIDRTGLKAKYDLQMEWAQDMGVRGPEAEKLEAPQSDSSGPSIFTAIQQQLGLKLESQKGPVEIIVIDRAEKPSEN